MQILPAIDIRGGQCVRLQQGDYQRETVFAREPLAMAKQWVAQGATYLHLVDLDGARDGRVINREAIRAIVEGVPVPCQLGGGVRDEEAIAGWLDVGLDRLVVGTRAVQEPAWFSQMVERFPGRLILGIDARNGLVATEGWLQTSQVRAIDLARSLASSQVAAIVYTDISRDGMLQGPNTEAMTEMKLAVSTPVIASGGVSQLTDVQQLADCGLDGCIIGRALYEGRIVLADALAVGRKEQGRRG